MIKPLVHDPLFLSLKSNPATIMDIPVAKDLLDTLAAHKDSCVGMAANMIGKNVCIICFENNDKYTTMLNPEIIEKSCVYKTQESCLSLVGGPRPAVRYKKITVKYYTTDFKYHQETFDGFTAQIIQHEIDHLGGILI